MGTFALQLAKAFGAEVTGVDAAGKLDMLRSIGVDCVVDYTQEDFTSSAERYDFILDLAGNRGWSECKRALTPDGTYVLDTTSSAVRVIVGSEAWVASPN